jgi:polar amino acid transport system substrate-binding protein
MKFRFLSLLVVLSLALAAMPAVAQDELPDLEGREVVVAVENAYPPFNFIDEETGEPDGWDYETWIAICDF